MLMKPYLITMDLEAKKIEVDEKDKEENTIKEAEQIAVSYGYTIYVVKTIELKAKKIEVDEKDKEENTIKEAEQIAVSYGYTIYVVKTIELSQTQLKFKNLELSHMKN
ncbi:hypothetical protein Glove_85g64 [Diversispora epigaea]|uniref:Uncharacterized protein n=1 Tax=Diversispora epigaea TaxID=1348612 RepID=A0A397JAM6_9GLOM|nr:hypothetical protein Glove_85g64 [Diversispora epigaea]